MGWVAHIAMGMAKGMGAAFFVLCYQQIGGRQLVDADGECLLAGVLGGIVDLHLQRGGRIYGNDGLAVLRMDEERVGHGGMSGRGIGWGLGTLRLV